MLASIMDPKFLFNKWLTLASHGETDLHSFEFNNRVNERECIVIYYLIISKILCIDSKHSMDKNGKLK
jgi:hypothetical protein